VDSFSLLYVLSNIPDVSLKISSIILGICSQYQAENGKKSVMMFKVDHSDDLWPKQTFTLFEIFAFMYDLSRSGGLLNKALKELNQRLVPARVLSCFEIDTDYCYVL